jgi:hypothetical protein
MHGNIASYQADGLTDEGTISWLSIPYQWLHHIVKLGKEWDRGPEAGEESHLLVQQSLNVEGLHDIGVELRVQESVSDTLVQQLAHLHIMTTPVLSRLGDAWSEDRCSSIRPGAIMSQKNVTMGLVLLSRGPSLHWTRTKHNAGSIYKSLIPTALAS